MGGATNIVFYLQFSEKMIKLKYDVHDTDETSSDHALLSSSR